MYGFIVRWQEPQNWTSVAYSSVAKLPIARRTSGSTPRDSRCTQRALPSVWRPRNATSDTTIPRMMSAEIPTVSAIAQSSAVPQRTISPPSMAVVAASAVPTRLTLLLLQRLYVGDEIGDIGVRQLRIWGHRLRPADSNSALFDRLGDLGVVEILQPAAARRPVAGLVLQLQAHRAVAGA